MTKIGKVPEFTDGDAHDATPTEEVKEQEETLDEETTESDTSEDEKSTEDKVEDIKDDTTTSEPDKLVALEGLRKQEEALDKDTSELDKEIAARKLRISEKRTDRREKRDLVDKIGDKLPENESDSLSDIDAATLSVLDRYTKAKGLVPKSELENISFADKHKSAQQLFFEKHPQYLPNNDKDDILYNAIQRELSLYAKPKDAALIPKLFEKAHSEVKKLYPTMFKETSITDKVNAGERMKAASLGSGNTGGAPQKSAPAKTKLSDYQVQTLQRGGWTDEEIASLNK